MTTTDQDVEMWSGDSKVLRFTVTGDDGLAKDLTGATIKWQMAKSVAGPALLTKTVGSGITVAAPVTGVFEVTLSPSDTAALKGTFYHEAEIIDALTNVATVSTGTVTINRDLVNA